MAKTNKYDQLKQELIEQLGLDQLTRDKCIEGLFGELGIADYLPRERKTSRRKRRRRRPRSRAGSAPEETIRVVQTGPGRRHDPPEPDSES